MKIISRSEKQTMRIGKKLARHLNPKDIICLIGDLGSGKTTLVKGIAEGLNINQKKITSPTFVLLNIYKGKIPLYHFDLYRLEGEVSMRSVGFEEFLYDEGVSVIEWADRLGGLMPKEYLQVQLKHLNGDKRSITLKPKGKKYGQYIKNID